MFCHGVKIMSQPVEGNTITVITAEGLKMACYFYFSGMLIVQAGGVFFKGQSLVDEKLRIRS